MTNQSIGQLTGSLTASSNSLPTVSQNRCSPSAASEAARTLLGLFRKGDAEDPDTYVAGIAAMLAKYPEDIAKRVCGPFGVAAKAKFLPTLSEVRDACEEAMRPRYEAAARDAEERRRAAQLAERKRIDEQQAAVDPNRVRRVADKFIADVKADLSRPRSSNDMTIAEAENKLAMTKPIPQDVIERDLARLMATPSLTLGHPHSEGG